MAGSNGRDGTASPHHVGDMAPLLFPHGTDSPVQPRTWRLLMESPAQTRVVSVPVPRRPFFMKALAATTVLSLAAGTALALAQGWHRLAPYHRPDHAGTTAKSRLWKEGGETVEFASTLASARSREAKMQTPMELIEVKRKEPLKTVDVVRAPPSSESERSKVVHVAPGATCRGSVDVAGHGSLQVVNALWRRPKLPSAPVDVPDNGRAVVPRLNSRAYLAESCQPGEYRADRYAALKLLGGRIRYTTDLARAGCGCNAQLHLIPMHQSKKESKCRDYYCSHGWSACGALCADIGLQDSNQYAWSSQLHVLDDKHGACGGYGGGAGSMGRQNWNASQYGPGARCIDTFRPFEVEIAFPVDPQGYLKAMEVKLSQEGSHCPLTLRIDDYSHNGRDGLRELSKVLTAGVTPMFSYWSSSNLKWLDGAGPDGKVPCETDRPKACPESVRFYNFAVHEKKSELDASEGANAAGKNASKPAKLEKEPKKAHPKAAKATGETAPKPKAAHTTGKNLSKHVEVKKELPDFKQLFCLALIVPRGYEPMLVSWQHKHRTGIFGCDDHAVYSNESLDLGGGLKNKMVYQSLQCAKGGQWNTLMNTPIFLNLWKQVVKDGQFWLANWTVKADADAVFIAGRLRSVVSARHVHPQWGNGMFSDNCGYTRSLHGPLELFSRRALVVWSERGMKECKQPPQEDVYMRECMITLGVTEVHDFSLLAEKSCHWDWWSCQSDHVAFHPFKTLDDYKGCLWRLQHPTPAPSR